MKQDTITHVLKTLKLDGWRILFKERQSSSLYFAKKKLETALNADRTQAEITIYKKFGKQLGDSSFTLFSDDEQEIKQKVKDALIICSTAKKDTYPLPSKGKSTVKLADPQIQKAFDDGTTEELLLSLWTEINKTKATIASCELSLITSTATIVNSTGFSVSNKRTKLFIELPILAKTKDKELEFLAEETFTRLQDFKPKEFVQQTLSKAKDIVTAKNFGKHQEGKLVLSGDALRDFWSPDISTNSIVFHASARAKHMSLSTFEKNKKIGNLTLYSNPLLDYNPSSSSFDEDGTASKKICILKEGKWQQQLSSQRYATYLNIPATGSLGSIEIPPGTGISTKDCIEIVSFSSFVPNGPSGDFSAEIRLGYVHQNGKKIPIRAAMFTGNLFKMLNSITSSKKLVEMDGYKGPEKMRFDEGVSLAGF